MRTGVHYFPAYLPDTQGSVAAFYQNMFEQIALAESLGFDDAWVTEHHFDEFGGTVSDPATFLAALAARTSRIRIGVAIVVMPLQNPVQVAESYGMVDVLSNGRLEFGVGRGSTAAEFQSFGVDLGIAPAMLKEGTELVQRAWTDDVISFQGQFYNYQAIRVLPKPVQRPHPPMWVGASRSDDTFRWAGAKGFGLMVLPNSYPPATLRQNIDGFRAAAAAAGHDPATRQVLAKFHVYVHPDRATAKREGEVFMLQTLAMNDARNPARAGRGGGDYTIETEHEKGTIIAGDPAECIDRLHYWTETLGLTAMSGTFYFGAMAQPQALANIRLFGEQVAPALSKVGAVG